MKTSRMRTLLAVLVLILPTVILSGIIGHARKLLVQDAEKSLDIERYPNEPLELVDIKVGEKSLKDNIKIKSRDNISKWGRDNVKFKEKDGWFKHLKIRLRNISGRPIYGLRAGLDFQPPDQRILFRLPLTWTRELKRDPLQPGNEIDLEVNDLLVSRAMDRMIPYTADANLSLVSFSLDDAYFSDDLMWSRGVLLRRDPYNPYKWDPADKPAPPGASLLKTPAGFTLASFKTNFIPAQSTQTCQAERSGREEFQCDGDMITATE
jgi:hypothetical protein